MKLMSLNLCNLCNLCNVALSFLCPLHVHKMSSSFDLRLFLVVKLPLQGQGHLPVPLLVRQQLIVNYNYNILEQETPLDYNTQSQHYFWEDFCYNLLPGK